MNWSYVPYCVHAFLVMSLLMSGLRRAQADTFPKLNIKSKEDLLRMFAVFAFPGVFTCFFTLFIDGWLAAGFAALGIFSFIAMAYADKLANASELARNKANS